MSYSLELTPNIKTKSYRILEDGIEIARNLSKKTALLFVERLNTKLQEVNENEFSSNIPNQSGQSSNSIPEKQADCRNDRIRDDNLSRLADKKTEDFFRESAESKRREAEAKRRGAEAERRAAEAIAEVREGFDRLESLHRAIREQAALRCQNEAARARRGIEQETIEVTSTSID